MGGFVSGAVVLAEFAEASLPHFLAHCAAVTLVVLGKRAQTASQKLTESHAKLGLEEFWLAASFEF
eukprot:COSAG04_NODE_2273_length_4414_cov_2.355968_3_plen_66_part_00